MLIALFGQKGFWLTGLPLPSFVGMPAAFYNMIRDIPTLYRVALLIGLLLLAYSSFSRNQIGSPRKITGLPYKANTPRLPDVCTYIIIHTSRRRKQETVRGSAYTPLEWDRALAENQQTKNSHAKVKADRSS